VNQSPISSSVHQTFNENLEQLRIKSKNFLGSSDSAQVFFGFGFNKVRHSSAQTFCSSAFAASVPGIRQSQVDISLKVKIVENSTSLYKGIGIPSSRNIFRFSRQKVTVNSLNCTQHCSCVFVTNK